MKIYYANARIAGKTCLLGGPFEAGPLAAATLPYLIPTFEADNPELKDKCTFGVLEVNAPQGLGIYNRILRANGIPVEVAN